MYPLVASSESGYLSSAEIRVPQGRGEMVQRVVNVDGNCLHQWKGRASRSRSDHAGRAGGRQGRVPESNWPVFSICRLKGRAQLPAHHLGVGNGGTPRGPTPVLMRVRVMRAWARRLQIEKTGSLPAGERSGSWGNPFWILNVICETLVNAFQCAGRLRVWRPLYLAVGIVRAAGICAHRVVGGRRVLPGGWRPGGLLAPANDQRRLARDATD